MLIHFVKTDGYSFELTGNGRCETVSSEGCDFDTKDQTSFHIKQLPKKDTGSSGDIMNCFWKLYISSPIRACFLYRKSIQQEESPIFLEGELNVKKNSEQGSAFFTCSDFSDYDATHTKPALDTDSSLALSELTYFADSTVMKANKSRQLCRKLANILFLATLDLIFFIYTVIEKVYNASVFSLLFFALIAIFGALSLFKASRKYKVYQREINARILYLNDRTRDKGSKSGLGL